MSKEKTYRPYKPYVPIEWLIAEIGGKPVDQAKLRYKYLLAGSDTSIRQESWQMQIARLEELTTDPSIALMVYQLRSEYTSQYLELEREWRGIVERRLGKQIAEEYFETVTFTLQHARDYQSFHLEQMIKTVETNEFVVLR